MRRQAGFVGIPMPYLILAIIALAAGSYMLGHFNGVKDTVLRQRSELLEHTQRAIRQANELAKQDSDLLTAHEAKAERIRTIFQTIDREVIRYVQDHANTTSDCLDSDGMRLWRAANAGSIKALPASKLDYSLSTRVAATGIGQGAGSAGQPRGNSEALPRVQGQARGLGGLGS